MASQLATQVLGFATTVVVAHFLTPREVGLVTMALVFANLSLVITDAGLAATLVQKEKLSEDDSSTAFWSSAAIGTAMTALGVGLSWPIAKLYGEPKVQVFVAVMCGAIFLGALGIVQSALLAREIRFKRLELRNVAAASAGAASTILLATAGAGPWALVIPVLVVSGVSTALLWRASDWRPRAIFSTRSLREMAGFSSHVLGTRLIWWGRSNTDNLLIGRYVGAARLGAYSFAFNLMAVPITRVAGPITQVFFPAFSRIREPSKIAELWLRAVRLVAVVVMPAMLGLIAVAPDFIGVLFGGRWHEAVPVLQILAPLGMVQALQALNYGILQSIGRAATLFRYTVFASVLVVGSFVAGVHWGIEGVATAYALASLVIEPVYLVLTARAVDVTVASWLQSIAGVGIAAAVTAALAFAGRLGLIHLGVPAGARLAILVASAIAVYLPLLRILEPTVFEELGNLRRGRSASSSS
jgi:O-antigen/teichoic acid export membrane protein